VTARDAAAWHSEAMADLELRRASDDGRLFAAFVAHRPAGDAAAASASTAGAAAA
jgi:hypothetical protein